MAVSIHSHKNIYYTLILSSYIFIGGGGDIYPLTTHGLNYEYVNAQKFEFVKSV